MSTTLPRSLLACGALLLGLGNVSSVLAQSRPPTTEQLGLDPSARRQLEEQKNAREMREQQGLLQQQRDQQWQDTLRHQQAQHDADVGQGQAVLRTWQKRPPLPAERNPLLGRWNSLGATAAAARKLGAGNELAAALLGGITGGMCDSMLGRGLIEFRPTTLVAVGRDGRERVMYHVAYRGGGSRVVVLPQDATSFTHMIIDFDSPDRATVAAVGCAMARAGSATAAAATAPTTTTAPAATHGEGAVGEATAAVLALTASATEQPGQFTPIVGRDVRLLKGSADTALIRGGLQSTPDGSVMHHFMLACQRHTTDCQKGMNAIQANTVSMVKTDASGSARTATLPPGRYYVFGAFVFNQKPMVWQLPIDLRAGSNSLALNVANAYPVD